jgi:site-specific DNA-cytosine methylase
MSANINMTKNKAKAVSVLRLGEHKTKTANSKNTNKRIWIVNKKIAEVFSIGEKYTVNYNKADKYISLEKADLFTGTNTISSRCGDTPIIDIKNKEIEATLGSDVEKIEVLYFDNQIVIKVSKTEKYKNQRANKKGLNTFEFFSGGGTLSHFFKEAGFNIIGGLELDPEYQALFHTNHESDEIFSIGGRLEDIHTSYFPKNVDVVLSGIPCTKYSNGNVKLKTAMKAKREGKEYDEEALEELYTAEALTFYLLTAIRAMNPRTIVVEEVVAYSESPASMMLRTVLKQMGYKISENVAEGMHTKRKRWVMVADMNNTVNLNNLDMKDGKTLEAFLDTSTENREWLKKEDFPKSRLNDDVGIRFATPDDIKCNTFTTNDRRATDPILKHPTLDLYSRFSNDEVKRIHGLDNYKLSGAKICDREVLGQGVTEMFFTVANRIIESYKDNEIVGTYKGIYDTHGSRIVVDDSININFTATLNTLTSEITVEYEYGVAKNLYDIQSFVGASGEGFFICEVFEFNNKFYEISERNNRFVLGDEISKEEVDKRRVEYYSYTAQEISA